MHKWVMKNDPNAESGILSEGTIQGSMDRAMGVFYGKDNTKEFSRKPLS